MRANRLVGLLSRRKDRIPETQDEEVLYILLKNNSGVSRAKFMSEGHILNAPACIERLRKRGIVIETERVNGTNKFGRPVTYGIYKLTNPKYARDYYRSLGTSQ